MRKKRLERPVARAGVRAGRGDGGTGDDVSVGKKGAGWRRSCGEHKDGTEEGQSVLTIPTKVAEQTARLTVSAMCPLSSGVGARGDTPPPVIIFLVSSWLR